jgi:hypothetical protein
VFWVLAVFPIDELMDVVHNQELTEYEAVSVGPSVKPLGHYVTGEFYV